MAGRGLRSRSNQIKPNERKYVRIPRDCMVVVVVVVVAVAVFMEHSMK